MANYRSEHPETADTQNKGEGEGENKTRNLRPVELEVLRRSILPARGGASRHRYLPPGMLLGFLAALILWIGLALIGLWLTK